MTVKFKGKMPHAKLQELSQRPLVINGAVFRALRRKPRESATYYIRTNEIFEGGVLHEDPESDMLSLEDVIDWANPIDLNQDQVTSYDLDSLLPPVPTQPSQSSSKYSARLDILFSDSVPLACVIKEENIYDIDDICELHAGFLSSCAQLSFRCYRLGYRQRAQVQAQTRADSHGRLWVCKCSAS
jgi:hypothetical protein